MSEKNSSLIGSKIPSPCKNKCNYDQRNDKTCSTCFRTEQERYEWNGASDWRKIQVLGNCLIRRLDDIDKVNAWVDDGELIIDGDTIITLDHARAIVAYFDSINRDSHTN